jgi:hypothetical protein
VVFNPLIRPSTDVMLLTGTPSRYRISRCRP